MLVYPEIITLDISSLPKFALVTIVRVSSPLPINFPLNESLIITVTSVFPPIVCPAPAASGKLSPPNLSNETFAVVKPDSTNALFPMLVTVSGMVMEVKLDAPWNALFPMLVTVVGMDIPVKLDAPANA